MKKEYEALSVDVVKFEAQDVITASGDLPGGTQGGNQTPLDPPRPPLDPNVPF